MAAQGSLSELWYIANIYIFNRCMAFRIKSMHTVDSGLQAPLNTTSKPVWRLLLLLPYIVAYCACTMLRWWQGCPIHVANWNDCMRQENWLGAGRVPTSVTYLPPLTLSLLPLHALEKRKTEWKRKCAEEKSALWAKVWGVGRAHHWVRLRRIWQATTGIWRFWASLRWGEHEFRQLQVSQLLFNKTLHATSNDIGKLSVASEIDCMSLMHVILWSERWQISIFLWIVATGMHVKCIYSI